MSEYRLITDVGDAAYLVRETSFAVRLKDLRMIQKSLNKDVTLEEESELDGKKIRLQTTEKLSLNFLIVKSARVLGET